MVRIQHHPDTNASSRLASSLSHKTQAVAARGQFRPGPKKVARTCAHGCACVSRTHVCLCVGVAVESSGGAGAALSQATRPRCPPRRWRSSASGPASGRVHVRVRGPERLAAVRAAGRRTGLPQWQQWAVPVPATVALIPNLWDVGLSLPKQVNLRIQCRCCSARAS